MSAYAALPASMDVLIIQGAVLEDKRGEAFIRSIRSAMPEGRSRASFIAQAVRARLPKGLTTQGRKLRLD